MEKGIKRGTKSFVMVVIFMLLMNGFVTVIYGAVSQEIKAQIDILDSYKENITSENQFLADGWNTHDPIFSGKIGIIGYKRTYVGDKRITIYTIGNINAENMRAQMLLGAYAVTVAEELNQDKYNATFEPPKSDGTPLAKYVCTLTFVNRVLKEKILIGSNVRVLDDALVLGKTTIEDVVSRYGVMELKDVQLKNNAMKIGSYNLFKASEGADLIPSKSRVYLFYEGRLVGYNYTNSFPGDSTDFDGSKRSQIKEKESTISEVVRLFGPPNGKSIYPVADDVNSTVIKYEYFQVKRHPIKGYYKILKFTIDNQGIVTKISYYEYGEK